MENYKYIKVASKKLPISYCFKVNNFELLNNLVSIFSLEENTINVSVIQENYEKNCFELPTIRHLFYCVGKILESENKKPIQYNENVYKYIRINQKKNLNCSAAFAIPNEMILNDFLNCLKEMEDKLTIVVVDEVQTDDYNWISENLEKFISHIGILAM